MLSAATWMDPEIVILSQVRERQISYDTAYMWNLKKGYKWTYLQNRNRVTDVENTLTVIRGFGGVWTGRLKYTHCVCVLVAQ